MSAKSTILVASTNQNKIRELQTVGQRYQLHLVSPADLQSQKQLSASPKVEESGNTYLANALLKANAYAAWGECPALGDDSGLEVEALGGNPGIYSARYGGEGKSDSERVSLLLEEIFALERKTGVKNRAACFKCSLVLAYPDGNTIAAEASLAGEILDRPRGDKGFGYDPIVYLYEIGKTLAEVDFDVTCKSGFRAKAAERLFECLRGK